jgi:hypothetical protein
MRVKGIAFSSFYDFDIGFYEQFPGGVNYLTPVPDKLYHKQICIK